MNYTKEGKMIWHFWSTLKNTFEGRKKKKKREREREREEEKQLHYSTQWKGYYLYQNSGIEPALYLYGLMVANGQSVNT